MIDRRTALKHFGIAASALVLTQSLGAEGFFAGQAAAAVPAPAPAPPPTGPFTLPPLPYAYDAL